MSVLILRRELDFLLYDWLKLDALFSHDAFAEHSRETVDAFLDLAEQVATDEFLPCHRTADIEEPWIDQGGVHVLPALADAVRTHAQLGFLGAGFPEALGGMGLPFAATSAAFGQFSAANTSAAGYAMLTVANARLIATFGSARQVETFALPQIEGRWFGTMCLSEPQAGSSLGDIATRAEPDGEDEYGARYRLAGNKMWISGGDQDISDNIVHLVLAKAPGPDGRLPEGSRGISLFIVPKRLPDGKANDVAVAGLNHKMGFRGTTNCLLNFGEGGGAVGWRVGREGDGLRQMFQMMNEARIGVGLGAASLAYRGYRHAVDYARERKQGRVAGTSGGAPVALIEHADVRHMLLAQKVYAEGAVALCLYCARLVDEHGDAAASALLALLTPVAKTWPSEFGLLANDLAIQVHGGYGYTRDFPVEQLYRDNRLNPIHEGTTGIQANDLLGRKILRDDGAGLAEFQRRLRDTAARAAAVPVLAMHGEALEAAMVQVLATIAVVREAPSEHALDNATAFLRGFGHVVVAWLWLDQALVAAAGAQDAFTEGKLRACRYMFEAELPKIGPWLSLVASRTDVAATAPPDIF